MSLLHLHSLFEWRSDLADTKWTTNPLFHKYLQLTVHDCSSMKFVLWTQPQQNTIAEKEKWQPRVTLWVKNKNQLNWLMITPCSVSKLAKWWDCGSLLCHLCHFMERVQQWSLMWDQVPVTTLWVLVGHWVPVDHVGSGESVDRWVTLNPSRSGGLWGPSNPSRSGGLWGHFCGGDGE